MIPEAKPCFVEPWPEKLSSIGNQQFPKIHSPNMSRNPVTRQMTDDTV